MFKLSQEKNQALKSDQANSQANAQSHSQDLLLNQNGFQPKSGLVALVVKGNMASKRLKSLLEGF